LIESSLSKGLAVLIDKYDADLATTGKDKAGHYEEYEVDNPEAFGKAVKKLGLYLKIYKDSVRVYIRGGS